MRESCVFHEESFGWRVLKDNLTLNLQATGFTKDPSQGGIAMHEAYSSSSHDHCLSQLPFESGLAEHMTYLTNEWQMNISS